jgi:hypothetical protein
MKAFAAYYIVDVSGILSQYWKWSNFWWHYCIYVRLYWRPFGDPYCLHQRDVTETSVTLVISTRCHYTEAAESTASYFYLKTHEIKPFFISSPVIQICGTSEMIALRYLFFCIQLFTIWLIYGTLDYVAYSWIPINKSIQTQWQI